MINRTMQDRLNRAKAEPELKQIVAHISEIWDSHSQPEPDQGTTTGARGNRHMTEYSDADDELLVNRFNFLTDLLWDLVDLFPIGAGIWYTHYYRTPEWGEYVEAAEPIISEFIDAMLWEAVCNNWIEGSKRNTPETIRTDKT